MANAHMVGYHVHDQPHTKTLQLSSKTVKFLLQANFWIKSRVVGDVVTMRTAGTCHQKRRGVAVGDAEIVQIFNN